MIIHIWLSGRHIHAYLKGRKFQLFKNFSYNLFMGKWYCITIRHKHIGSGYLSFWLLDTWNLLSTFEKFSSQIGQNPKWQTLAFPAILREVLAPVQSSTSQWPPLKNLIWKLVRSLGWEDPLKEEMATHSSILAWRIPWTKEPGRLQSMGLQRVRHDWASEQQYFRNQVLVVGATPPSQAQ